MKLLALVVLMALSCVVLVEAATMEMKFRWRLFLVSWAEQLFLPSSHSHKRVHEGVVTEQARNLPGPLQLAEQEHRFHQQ